jgi:hypothetical protein
MMNLQVNLSCSSTKDTCHDEPAGKFILLVSLVEQDKFTCKFIITCIFSGAGYIYLQVHHHMHL